MELISDQRKRVWQLLRWSGYVEGEDERKGEGKQERKQEGKLIVAQIRMMKLNRRLTI